MKHIIIAEKPSVAIEYAKVLGAISNKKQGYFENDSWIVTWALGHLVCLSYPEKYDESLKEWKMESLPFLPSEYKYEILADKKSQFQVIKKLYNRSDIDTIYYAGDAGREGLYIQMLIRAMAGHSSTVDEKVVWIDSQTEDEILRGIKEAKPLSSYLPMSDAGYARAESDFLLGINLSRALSLLYGTMLSTGSGQKRMLPISVGRVMTCVLGMIVGREREIRNFKVKEFYQVKGNLCLNDETIIPCKWKVNKNSLFYNSPELYSDSGFHNEADATDLIQSLDDKITILSIEKKTEKKYAPLFFNLAELQGECTKVLHISPAETLKIAQSLYEKKLTTYPRTDARVLSSAVAQEIKKNLSGLRKGGFSSYVEAIEKNNYSLPSKFVDDSKITDHYAIIPTGYCKNGNDLTSSEATVYCMIVKRFLAAFYPPAEYETTHFEGTSHNETFLGNNKILVKKGYLDVLSDVAENEIKEQNVSSDSFKLLKKGDSYKSSFEIDNGKTVPPKRFTSGSMVLAMENAGKLIEDDELREQIKSSGIGTSATRADIIEKLLKIKYINENKQILTPSNLGEMVYEVVKVETPDLLSPQITAEWERKLTDIANSNLKKVNYDEEFHKYIENTVCHIKNGGEEKFSIVKTAISHFATNSIRTNINPFESWNTTLVCPLCGDEIETTQWGFRCKSYDKKDNEKCSFQLNGNILNHSLLTNELAELLSKGRTGPFYDFLSTKNKPFAAYLTWSQNTHSIGFDFTDMPIEKMQNSCPKCGKQLVKQGSFYKCIDNIDKEHGCSFFVGKIAGKALNDKQIIQLIEEGQTDVIKGFKNAMGNKFDARLILDNDKNIAFSFPSNDELKTDLKCPICGGSILNTSKGFRCEKYKRVENRTDDDCSFFASKVLGHTIKKKDLEQMLSEGKTDSISFKNQSGKSFDARLAWDNEEKKIKLVFDENKQVETNLKCPLCFNNIVKTKYGYACSKKSEGTCQFSIGAISGVVLEEEQLRKLLEDGKTDLIDGFKPKEKGKKPFSAYLIWDSDEKKISFNFPSLEERRELSSYNCPTCGNRLYNGKTSYYCTECKFTIYKTISSVEIPEDQIDKLLRFGRSDVIQGFFSPTKRKRFSARLAIDKQKNVVAFSFLDMKVEV